MAAEKSLFSTDFKIYSPFTLVSGAFKSLHGSRETQKQHGVAVLPSTVITTQTGCPSSSKRANPKLPQGSLVKLRNSNKQILTGAHKYACIKE